MKEWLIALVPLVGVALGAFLAFVFTSRTKRDESIMRFKEQKYAKLFVKLQGLVGSTSSTQLKKKFIEEQYQCCLYASDDVVTSIDDLIRLVIENRGSDPIPELGRKVADVATRRRCGPTSKKTLNSITPAFVIRMYIKRRIVSTHRSHRRSSMRTLYEAADRREHEQ